MSKHHKKKAGGESAAHGVDGADSQLAAQMSGLSVGTSSSSQQGVLAGVHANPNAKIVPISIKPSKQTIEKQTQKKKQQEQQKQQQKKARGGNGGGRGGGGGGRGRGGGGGRTRGNSGGGGYRGRGRGGAGRGRGGGGRGGRPRRNRFEPHLSPEEVQRGVESGHLWIGEYRVRRDDGYVTIDGGPSIDVYIPTRTDSNRAFNKDTVAICIDPDRSHWKTLTNERSEQLARLRLLGADADFVDTESESGSAAPSPAVPRKANHHTGGGHFTAEELESAYDADGAQLQPTGKVVAIVEANHPVEVIGRLRSRDGNFEIRPDDTFATLLPNDLKVPKMLLPLRTCPREFLANPRAFERKLVAARIVRWEPTSYFPDAVFSEVFGDMLNVKHEERALLHVYGISDRPFSAEALACLPPESEQWTVPAEELARRRDYRKHRIFTIDPATARDLDDALHCTALPNGNFEVGVHIADVTHFLRAGTALDKVASQRATTTYLVTRAVPMLPRVLCENLCSLHPGVDRLAYSVVWELTPSGDVVSEWIGRTVIRSCAKLPYSMAQKAIDGVLQSSWMDGEPSDEELLAKLGLLAMDDSLSTPEEVAAQRAKIVAAKRRERDAILEALGPADGHTIEEIRDDVLALWSIAKQRRAARFASGAMNLNNAKLSFVLDERDEPVGAVKYVTKEANNMIEEFMLLANMRVARFISAAYPDRALLRQHDPPVSRLMDRLEQLLKRVPGLAEARFDGSSSLAFSQSLARVQEQCSPAVFAAVQDLATRPMQLAKYFCTGALAEAAWHHYGLNVGLYTHFTSPIRRYADCVVHRQVTAALAMQRAHGGDEEGGGGGAAAALERERVEHEVPSTKTCDAVASHCNERKLAARRAQQENGILYLCLMLRERPAVVEGVVVSLGERFVDVFLPDFGESEQVFLNDIRNLNGFVVNKAPEAPDGSLVEGEGGSVVVQWSLEYDENDPIFSVKRQQRERDADRLLADEGSGEGDGDDEPTQAELLAAELDELDHYEAMEKQLSKTRRNKKHAETKKARGTDRRVQTTRDRERDRAGDARANGDHPSNEESIEQRLQLFTVVRVKVTMRTDRVRPALRSTLLHPKHPEYERVGHTNESLEIDTSVLH